MSDKDTERKGWYEIVKNFSYRGQRIPGYMYTGIINYIVDRIEPGDFLSSILRNDLMGACVYADDTNLGLLPVYVSFFYNEAPTACWGSKENIQEWLTKT